MGIISQYRQDITSGIDEALVDKIGLATLTTTAKNLSGAVNELDARTTDLGTELEATQGWIADEYDTTRTYAVDDMVSYENELYKCITAVTSPEAFDENKWEATGVSYELSQHDSKLRQHDSDISALNSRFIVKTYSATTGSTQYANFYYNDITIDSIYGNEVSVFIWSVTSNRPAFVVRISAFKYRVFTNVADTTVSIKVMFDKLYT